MSEATDNKFLDIVQKALSDASNVTCSKEEYADGLGIMSAEINIAEEAARTEVKNAEVETTNMSDDEEPEPLPDIDEFDDDDPDEFDVDDGEDD